MICGAISQYNAPSAVKGPANYLSLLVNRARMEGMVVFDYTDRFPFAIAELSGYLADGRMKSKEDVMGLQAQSRNHGAWPHPLSRGDLYAVAAGTQERVR